MIATAAGHASYQPLLWRELQRARTAWRRLLVDLPLASPLLEALQRTQPPMLPAVRRCAQLFQMRKDTLNFCTRRPWLEAPLLRRPLFLPPTSVLRCPRCAFGSFARLQRCLKITGHFAAPQALGALSWVAVRVERRRRGRAWGWGALRRRWSLRMAVAWQRLRILPPLFSPRSCHSFLPSRPLRRKREMLHFLFICVPVFLLLPQMAMTGRAEA